MRVMKRVLAASLAVMMAVCALPANVYAADQTDLAETDAAAGETTVQTADDDTEDMISEPGADEGDGEAEDPVTEPDDGEAAEQETADESSADGSIAAEAAEDEITADENIADESTEDENDSDESIADEYALTAASAEEVSETASTDAATSEETSEVAATDATGAAVIEETLEEEVVFKLRNMADLDNALSADLTGVSSYPSAYNFTSLEDFNEDIFLADVLVNNPTVNDNVHLFLDMTSPAETLIEDLDENGTFYAAVQGWKILTFEADEAVEDTINFNGLTEQEYYETILLDMLVKTFDDEKTAEILKDSFSTDIYNNLGAAADLFGEMDADTLTEVINQLSNMDIASSGEFVKAFAEYFGETMTVMDIIVGNCQNVYEFVETYTAYQSLKKFCGTSMVSTLDRMAADCPSSKNPGMHAAIIKIRDLCENEMAAEVHNLILGAKLDINIFSTTVLNTFVNGAITAAGGGLVLALKTLSEGYANMAFNTGDTVGQYFLMSSYADMVEHLRQSVVTAENRFKNSNTKENARYLIDSLGLYFTALENGCDYANEFADILHRGTAHGELTDSDYSQFESHCSNIKQSYQNAHTFLLTLMWLDYFKADHEEIYREYMELQDRSPDETIYVTGLSFVNASATWRKDSGVHILKVNIEPEEASNKAVKFTSSDSSVVSVTTDGRCTPQKVGTAVITATSMDGHGASAEMSVTVSNDYTTFDNAEGTLRYTVVGEEEVSVKAIKSAESYTIPSSVVDATDSKMYTVTQVAPSGFSSKSSVTSIVLPDTIEEIGSYAFYNCTKLSSINIPTSLKKILAYTFYKCDLSEPITLPKGFKEIGAYAFYGTGLTEVTLPETLSTIGNYAFAYCDVQEIELPEGLIELGEYAFNGCNDLQKVTFSNCYVQIEYKAFADCTALKQVELGRAVRAIDNMAFYRCIELPGIVIPTTVTSIGLDVFCDCKALESIAVSTNNPNYSSDSGVLFDKDKKTLLCYPDGKKETSYEVPDTVTTLGPQAFADNQYLEETILPDGLETIAVQAFSEALSLKRLEIPDSVTSMGYSVCIDCPALEYVKLSAGCTEIPSECFRRCQSLTEVVTADTIEKIGPNVFSACSFSEFDFPANLTRIGSRAFDSNKSLTAANITDSVTYIGEAAFFDCTSLSELHLPAGLDELGKSAFNNTALKELVIPEGITQILSATFCDNNYLTSVTIPSSVELIATSAFSSDEKLTKVILRGSLPSIAYNAFYYVEDLTIYYPAFDTSYDSVITSDNRYKARALKWAIDPATYVDISKCEVTLSKTQLTYTGKAQLPAVTVKYGGTAVSAQQYTVTGKNNKDVGIATIAIKGQNGLKGSVSRTITITPEAPAVKSSVNGTGGITVKWGKIASGTGYQLYRNNKLIKTFTKNTVVKFADTGAKKNGTVYSYKIRAFKTVNKQKIYSPYSAVFKAVYLSRPTVKLANTKAGKLTVKWGKNKKATGYQVKYVTGKSNKTVTVTKKATVSKVIKVKKGKTYKVYVRSYKKYGGKTYYSAWSAVKKLKITK